jgi:radical SAM superfamily enzyme YgiQ (UPF0313 family)
MDNKIFLLETSVEKQNRSPFKKNPNVTYSLGLAYLSSVLKKEGYETKTCDFADWDEEEAAKEIKKIIKEFNPNVVGISVMSMTRVSTYKTIKEIKEIDSSIKIVLGGVHASIMYEQLLMNFPIEAVVVGEGEVTITELISALIKNQSLKKIKGIAYKNNSNAIKNAPRELIQNLDVLPFPNHGAFMNPKRTRVNILSSRGCPFKCSFCCLYSISKRQYRVRSILSIIKEIEYILRKFPQINEIEFSDDTFTLNEQRVIELCNEITKKGINKKVKFICSGRIKPASDKMFKAMTNAGFVEIRFGIETGSRKMLNSIHKNVTPEDILETFKICSKFKDRIRFVKFLMVGFPGETWETVKESIGLIKKIQKHVPMDFFQASVLWVYPGTEIYDMMKSKGQIADDFWLSEEPCPYYTIEHNEEELNKMANYIAFKCAMDRGLFFMIPFILKKIKKNPRYEFKRILNRITTKFN